MTAAELRERLASLPQHAVVHVHIHGDMLCPNCEEVAAGWPPVADVLVENIGGTIVTIECEE
jgi:hypothetical protein